MITAFRIVKAKFAASAFEGIGSKLAGGRWNSPGVPVAYTSSCQSLAMLEMLVHLRAAELLLRYVVFTVRFDEAVAETIHPSLLPKNWRKSPNFVATRKLGDRWLANANSPVLRVPSSIIAPENSYLLNPLHPDFHKVTIGPRTPIKFDPRLLKERLV